MGGESKLEFLLNSVVDVVLIHYYGMTMLSIILFFNTRGCWNFV